MKPRIKSMIWNIRKQKTTNQNNKKKKESPPKKKKGWYKQLLEQLQAVQYLHQRVPEGKKKEQEIGNLFEKIM